MPSTKTIGPSRNLLQVLMHRLMTSLLLFGLVFELLRPWYRSSAWDIVFVPQVLAISALLILIWSVFVRSSLFQWLGYIAIMFGVLYKNFALPKQSILSWLSLLPMKYVNAIQEILQAGQFHMNDLLRITLLLIGWVILVISLQQLVWQFHVSISLVILAISYLVVLHFLFAIDIYNGLLLACLYGSLLVAITQYEKRHLLYYMPTQQSNHNTSISSTRQYQNTSHTSPHRGVKPFYFVVSMASVLVFMFVASFLLSMNKEREVVASSWSKSITNRFINDMTAFSTHVSGQPLSRQLTTQMKQTSGYSQNDNQLGAAITFTDKPVFRAWSTQPTYWRGEAKSHYTGQGWSEEEAFYSLHTIKSEADVIAAWSTQLGLRGSLITQQVEWITPTSQMPFFHGGINGSIVEADAVNPERALLNYIEDDITANLYPPTAQAQISTYKVLAELPITDEHLLREIEPIESELAEYVWQHEAIEQYLQLPEQLPVRVTALANEIAGGGLTSRYDQVKAIEQYLKTNYTYSTKSELPKNNQDFVDHFLFDQQQGYCVHFATSMVILLRAQDIPARYVKGYTSGDVIDERVNEEGYIEKLYEVGEQHAHAWVEVYFPGAGWVPFDPTPSLISEETSLGFIGSIQSMINNIELNSYVEKGLAFLNQYVTFLYIGLIAMGGCLCASFAIYHIRKSKFYLIYLYNRTYRHTLRWIDQLIEIKKQNDNVLSRTHHSKRQVNQLRHKMMHSFNTLVKLLEKLVDREINKLEKKARIQTNATLTRRQRIESLSQCFNQPTIDLLLSVCVWIETIQYSLYEIDELVHLLPLPKQLSNFSRHIRVDLSLSE